MCFLSLQVLREDWIQVAHESLKPKKEDEYDADGAIAAWEDMQEDGKRGLCRFKFLGTEITAEVLTEVAQKYSVFAGKWLLFFSASTVRAMEETWKKIASGVIDGTLGATGMSLTYT